jgi:hypothetical protein
LWDRGHHAGGGHATARLVRESEPGSSLRKGPKGGSCLSARERRRLGWEERDWAGWAARGREKEERLLDWALREERREGKKKEGVGRAKREIEGEKEMHLNAFEFEFEI